MALTTGERDAVARAFNRIVCQPGGGSTPYVKSVIRTAVDNADDWADANATSYNNALVAAFRTNATSAQKALLLALICEWRAGRVQPEGA